MREEAEMSDGNASSVIHRFLGNALQLSSLLEEDLDQSEGGEEPGITAATAAAAAAIGTVPSNEKDDDDDEEEMVDQEKCVECQDHVSEVFCEQCHEYFCMLCYEGQHRKGNRRFHTYQPKLNSSRSDFVGSNVSRSRSRSNTNDPDDDEADESSLEKKQKQGGSGRNICSVMGHLFLGNTAARPIQEEEQQQQRISGNGNGNGNSSSIDPVTINKKSTAHDSTIPRQSVRDRARYIPMRLTYEERKQLRTLEAALAVSNYTDKIDSSATLMAKGGKRLRMQLQELCGFFSGIIMSSDYQKGQIVLNENNFVEHAAFLQQTFELGRRYKIMNPEKMRGEYGKLLYLLQDSLQPEIMEMLGFSCHQSIVTVLNVLEEAHALEVLMDPNIEIATMVVAPEGKSRAQIRKDIQRKENAIQEMSQKYASATISKEMIQQCLYSIGDNNYHLYFERDPIDRMIEHLKSHFHPQIVHDARFSLAILSGTDGARLSHSHERQFNYVLQSLTLWREIAHDMFRLWYLTDEDILTLGNAYMLTDTGQGLQRIQQSPKVSRAMQVILQLTQRRLDHWVGSSVIHLGDRNVPNALMFIDKYAQVGHILRPILKTLEEIDHLATTDSSLKHYIDASFGGVKTLKQTILTDFFREAFDGSGADNFFEAGSCIDGRLTSAWNWCSNLDKKDFYFIFKLAGFIGFDGKFG